MEDARLSDVRVAIERLWPAETAEAWDRVGLVTGANDQPVRRILLAVDVTQDTVDEALSVQADLLLVHHPLLLRGVHSIAEDTAKGALLAALLRAGCALMSAHTNADAPRGGVSDALATAFGLEGAVPIAPSDEPDRGIGRVGELTHAMSLREFAERVAAAIPPSPGGVRVAGDPERAVRRVALCGGAGDSLLDHPRVRGADVYVTSDLRHHPAQESLEQSRVAGGPALIDISHWAAESVWLPEGAQRLRQEISSVDIRVSTHCTDPWSFRLDTGRQ